MKKIPVRAAGECKIEKTLQVPEVKELLTTMSGITERAGFASRLTCGVSNPRDDASHHACSHPTS